MPADPSQGERYADRVTRLIDDLEAGLLRILADALAVDITNPRIDGPTWAAERLARLQWLRHRIERAVAGDLDAIEAEIVAVVLDAYNHGTAAAVHDLDQAQIPVTPGGLPAVDRAVRLSREPVELVRRAAAMVPRILGAAYSEAVAAGAIDTLSGASTRLASTQRVLDRLLADGVRGFTDARGRRWSLDTYTEMAVRTTTGQAAVDGHVAQLSAAGQDLVVVSDSPRECPLCRPWEGKVLSLGGAVGAVVVPSETGGRPVTVTVAGTLAQARAAGFQHPNCTHRVTLYVAGATRLGRAEHDPDGYAAKQQQRTLERGVRSWKRREQLALDDVARARARRKVREWQGRLRSHVDEHDLKRLSRREQVGDAVAPRAR